MALPAPSSGVAQRSAALNTGMRVAGAAAAPSLGHRLARMAASCRRAFQEETMITLANWRSRMSEDMRLCDFRPRTQEGYMLAVRQFIDRVGREPETFTDEDVRAYFLYLREDKKLAPSSINIALHALRFFFIRTMQRDWKIFGLLRVHKPRLLPVVLSQAEVRAVLGAVQHPVRRMILTTIYALGLRLSEGLSLE